MVTERRLRRCPVVGRELCCSAVLLALYVPCCALVPHPSDKFHIPIYKASTDLQSTFRLRVHTSFYTYHTSASSRHTPSQSFLPLNLPPQAQSRSSSQHAVIREGLVASRELYIRTRPQIRAARFAYRSMGRMALFRILRRRRRWLW